MTHGPPLVHENIFSSISPYTLVSFLSPNARPIFFFSFTFSFFLQQTHFCSFFLSSPWTTSHEPPPPPHTKAPTMATPNSHGHASTTATAGHHRHASFHERTTTSTLPLGRSSSPSPRDATAGHHHHRLLLINTIGFCFGYEGRKRLAVKLKNRRKRADVENKDVIGLKLQFRKKLVKAMKNFRWSLTFVRVGEKNLKKCG
ncbi:uncharacterized protein LOC130727693 isoform X4 [Lotus japonicus]|uniref:uncharacterized protein LOC130727693 isoform X4 n=1 Tax=Lotus japonicus TaxID=34305 RepID=UPI002586F0C2|nr:uncharacterized protein LOC130727693 isoform X4 [Lotus japonicus]